MELLIIVLMLVLTLVSLAFSVSLVLIMIGWAWTGVPYVPIPRDALTRLPEAMSLHDDAVMYDLGCGDGIVIATLARHSKARFIGVDKAPLPVILATLRLLVFPNRNIRFLNKDMFSVDLSKATHVFLYLFPWLMEKLEPHLITHLKPGTRVVTCDFTFPNKVPDKSIPCENITTHTLHVYTF